METVKKIKQIEKFRKEYLEERLLTNQNENDCLLPRPRCGCEATDLHTCCRLQPDSNLNCNSDVIQ